MHRMLPHHFKNLQRVYQALNTVFTFCSARKHLHTTIENMRSSVESLLKAPLSLDSIAQIKTLLPTVIRFVYVETEALSSLTALSDKKNDIKKGFEIYGLPDQQASSKDPMPEPKKQHEALLFQFLDGELKNPQKSKLLITSQGSPRTPRGKKLSSSPLSLTQLLMPTYSPKVMTKMIEKRNAKFKDAVDELLSACAAHNPAVDPVKLLMESFSDNMPIPASAPRDQKVIQDNKQRLQAYLDHPETRPSVQELLSKMQQDVQYRDQIIPAGQRTTPSRTAGFGELKQCLSPTLEQALFATKQIRSLFSHQAEAINHLSDGEHVIVSTSTSSGKSIVYQIPMLQALEKDPSSCGLYIFPTKALAQDQKRTLSDLIFHCGEDLANTKLATFDGDTPREDRLGIRETANIIFTNPDMLHLTILPHEQLWRRLFQNLKLVVVDELHIYSGLFGVHMSFLMRRLRRICVGSSCSATIQNPVEHMKTIFSLSNVQLVSQDGSPSGAKHHVIWNPPLVDEKDPSQGRISSISEASRIFRFLIGNGIRTIVFCKIRKSCELMIRQVREELEREGRDDLSSRVKSYRSGYTAQERRVIEQEMFTGELLGIIATTALELGIDIGMLDAVLTVGFPHSLSGFRQQAGRAGRRNKESLAMLILDQGPSNQHFAEHPEDLFDAPHSEIRLDLDNEVIVAGHLQCAADEIPIHPENDQVYFGTDLPSLCQSSLIEDKHGYFHAHPRFQPRPAQHVSIRKNEEVSYSIVDVSKAEEPNILEEIESSRVMYECYEGAIFIHQGRTFQVINVNHAGAICKLREVDVDYLTRPRELHELDPIRTMKIKAISNFTSTIYGYLKLDRRQNVIDSYELKTEPLIQNSKALWIDLPSISIITLRKYSIHLPTAIHAAEHALLNRAGLLSRFSCSKGALTVDGAKFGAQVVLNGLLGREWQAYDEVRESNPEVQKLTPNLEDISTATDPIPVTDSVVVMDSDGTVLHAAQADQVLQQYHNHSKQT
ncbi:P-loop containing nucleoside triphosphate hydrolase protein [Melampsora americana]|nr:P-loop containing nucleoside triphosphate hydrolase protein [Melampsora americana]